MRVPFAELGSRPPLSHDALDELIGDAEASLEVFDILFEQVVAEDARVENRDTRDVIVTISAATHRALLYSHRASVAEMRKLVDAFDRARAHRVPSNGEATHV